MLIVGGVDAAVGDPAPDGDEDDSRATIDYGDQNLFVGPSGLGDFAVEPWVAPPGTIDVLADLPRSCGPVELLGEFPGMREAPYAVRDSGYNFVAA